MNSRGNVADETNVSSRAIRRKVKNTLDIAITKYKIDSYNLVDLDKVLNDVYCSFRPVSADYDIRKELVRSLNVMAVDIYGDSEEKSPVLEAYGSFVMDMYTSQSDLDVSINFVNGTSEVTREKKIQILERFAEKLRSLEGEGHVRNVESIVTARVPIVKFFDHGAAVECDLSVENKDGILNSQIIRIISQLDGRFQKLCMLVKHWAKAHDVNSALHRTLNSVSITMLVALHLQTQYPPILPPFSMLFQDGMDPPNVEKRTQKFLNWGQRNQESLGRLFATFFIKLQSVEFLWRQGLCVSVLNGLWIAKKWKKFGIASISVEDFTNVSQNVSRRVNGAGAKKIYQFEILFIFDSVS
ncbi:PREDICTED: protein HESO1-like [Camelina sativa]|uniref:Protein HESO1-like n=1 Tax=Camelina sativa TaxID=90675 RepID=A0ABM0YX45_CAMSA|nr:PREDICTED: protein HESO1-like [Camelina sativa]